MIDSRTYGSGRGVPRAYVKWLENGFCRESPTGDPELNVPLMSPYQTDS